MKNIPSAKDKLLLTSGSLTTSFTEEQVMMRDLDSGDGEFNYYQ